MGVIGSVVFVVVDDDDDVVVVVVAVVVVVGRRLDSGALAVQVLCEHHPPMP